MLCCCIPENNEEISVEVIDSRGVTEVWHWRDALVAPEVKRVLDTANLADGEPRDEILR